MTQLRSTTARISDEMLTLGLVAVAAAAWWLTVIIDAGMRAA